MLQRRESAATWSDVYRNGGGGTHNTIEIMILIINWGRPSFQRVVSIQENLVPERNLIIFIYLFFLKKKSF